ncbi:phytanoyl-CoA dioxygenase family protein [Nonomuraea sp. MG754425]|uniref:phytanoyl-CoA dioxygenase family protein n=1 Tax=Nonomuraea sp. MG754425 TaxID=2570319 RepID=UPI001F1C36C3|nr:phytanoyl-CoA dioxygenase family protein [Nonomuraea sp. MG754425]MCF6473400.1 phytanoyl-CoA dioxygenase family protein [Nonomuraea sp. MG754425]
MGGDMPGWRYEVTATDIDHFRVFGYVHVRHALSDDFFTALAKEIRTTLAQAFVLDQSNEEALGRAGFYLPMMGERTPVSRELCVDPGLLDVAERLLGAFPLLKPAKGILYEDASGWHADTFDRHLSAVKVAVYLDPLNETNGALRVIPGSHMEPFSSELTTWRQRTRGPALPLDEAAEARDWPAICLATEPGDALLFDPHLWHASVLGRRRYQWTVSYAAASEVEEKTRSNRGYIMSFLSDGHEYDRDTFPYIDAPWLEKHTSRMHRELRNAGVMP